MPRSVDSRKYWKASEWRNFLLFYSPVILRNLLPDKYYDHWMLLVFAVTTLLSSPSYEGVMHADLAIHKFVVLAKDLYGVEHLSFNVHLLTHLPTAVMHWGPLWAHSNFIFEDANGLLLKLFHGTQAVQKQICKAFLALRIVKRVYETHALSIPDCACMLIDRCLNIETRHKRGQNSVYITCLGTSTIKELTVQECYALERRMRSAYPHKCVKSVRESSCKWHVNYK